MRESNFTYLILLLICSGLFGLRSRSTNTEPGLTTYFKLGVTKHVTYWKKTVLKAMD